MGVFYEQIPKSLVEWIKDQKVFWVSTAPLSANGHVNVSPKGGKCFGIIDEKTFWYHDLTGSGNETISHLLEPGNGRITIMFNAFEGAPKIVRLWGHGTVLEAGTKEFSDFVDQHSVETNWSSRTIILVNINQVGSSCGFSVPYFDFKDFRPILTEHFAKKEKRFLEGNEGESMDRYWAHKNAWSMDGLPGLQRGLAAAKEHGVKPIKKMVGPLAPSHYSNGVGFATSQVVFIAFLSFLIGLAVSFYGAAVLEAAQSLLHGTPGNLKTGTVTARPAFQSLLALWNGE